MMSSEFCSPRGRTSWNHAVMPDEKRAADVHVTSKHEPQPSTGKELK